jgi:hypothetical protein
MEFKNAATKLRWDEAKQTVDYDDAWWQEHLVVSVTTLDSILLITHVDMGTHLKMC